MVGFLASVLERKVVMYEPATVSSQVQPSGREAHPLQETPLEKEWKVGIGRKLRSGQI